MADSNGISGRSRKARACTHHKCTGKSAFDAVDGSSARHVSAMDVGAVERSHNSEELSTQAVTTIGLDIAKSVFQVHGVDAGGQVVLRRQLKRRYVLAFFQKLPSCLVWYRSLRLVASSVARTAGAWPHRSPDAAASYRQRRASVSPHFDICPLQSTSPD